MAGRWPPGSLGGPAMLIKRSLTVAGHATSIALEAPFWHVLDAMAADEGLTLAALVARIDAGRGPEPLTSSLRVSALAYASRPQTGTPP